jgi:hypothetical protein
MMMLSLLLSTIERETAETSVVDTMQQDETTKGNEGSATAAAA